MTRPSIRTSLIGIFAAIAVLTAIFSVVALQSLSKTRSIADKVVTEVFPAVSAVKDIRIELVSMRLGYFQYLAALTPEATKTAESLLGDARVRIQHAVEVYTPYVSTDSERALLQRVTETLATYGKAGDDMIALAKVGNFQQASNMLETMGGIITPAQSALDDLIAGNTVRVNDATNVMHQTSADATLITFILIGVVATLLVASTLYILRGIASPIHSITAAMTGLAGGDTDSTIPYAQRTDEIGQMASAVEVFRTAAVNNKELQTQAESLRRTAEADRERLSAEAERAAQARLEQATSSLADGLRRLAAGDLSFRLDVPFAPDFEALRHDLNAAVSQLNETLAAVAVAADQIDNGAREVSESANDLSRRTEQQAASLEETAAALDQITANVGQSSMRTNEAREVASHANKSASRSGEVVAEAVTAMGRIEHSSSQISSIIGVIDEIAFQTNLLALNAGVEAARAGEAGRGFAVVAQEVRELAQRSAKAAKEIKDLIRNSTAEVESGVKLVRDTGDVLKTIEAHVIEINGHMEAIATSAREQSTGLAEVNIAVNQMDQVTQQNAAMVEETSAAGSTLASESARLRELISHFTLGGRSSNAQQRYAA
ncbi:methyl-accepting chemotaxis protein [Rhizobium sp. DKSPLA3]|uniref:Methyl-accepting chemotaxis protein n=1 Tax=Rhizobium quercicola TaxID=2901226 RepID=A0A9X1NQM0_9HYPH|nr:methyl-accepting chemotaxis protein [Rhizobium quercicola]